MNKRWRAALGGGGLINKKKGDGRKYKALHEGAREKKEQEGACLGSSLTRNREKVKSRYSTRELAA